MTPPTITEAFLRTVAASGSRTALRWQGDDGTWESLTFDELAERVASVAAGLRQLGLREGERVLLMMRTIPEFHVADLAVLFAGGTPVSIDETSSPERIAFLVGHTRAKIAIVEDRSGVARFDGSAGKVYEALKLVVVRSADATADREDLVPLEWLLVRPPLDLAVASRAIWPEDLATISYVSGATGYPAGVMVTHRNVAAQVAALRGGFAEDLVGKRTLAYLPMSHVGARAASHYLLAFTGLEIASCPDQRQLASYLFDVRPQILFGHAQMWEALRADVLDAVAQDPTAATSFDDAIREAAPMALARSWGETTPEQDAAWTELDENGLALVRKTAGLDQVEHAVTGTSPDDPSLIEWFHALGVPLAEAYGMAECTGAMTLSLRGVKPGTAGQPLPGIEVRIAKDGEVVCRGDVVSPGYLRDPYLTAEAFDDDGWFYTGDLGEIDVDGHLRIVDRKRKDRYAADVGSLFT